MGELTTKSLGLSTPSEPNGTRHSGRDQAGTREYVRGLSAENRHQHLKNRGAEHKNPGYSGFSPTSAADQRLLMPEVSG